MRTVLLKAIRAYQALSQALWNQWPGGLWYASCRFHPTCSEYCYNAILKYGVMRGVAKGTYRIIRCNPFSAGGVDEA